MEGNFELQLIAMGSIYIIFSSILVYAVLYGYSRFVEDRSIEVNKSVARTMLFISIFLMLAVGYAFAVQPDDIYNIVAAMIAYTLLLISIGYTQVPFNKHTIPVPYFISALAISMFLAIVFFYFYLT